MSEQDRKQLADEAHQIIVDNKDFWVNGGGLSYTVHFSGTFENCTFHINQTGSPKDPPPPPPDTGDGGD